MPYRKISWNFEDSVIGDLNHRIALNSTGAEVLMSSREGGILERQDNFKQKCHTLETMRSYDKTSSRYWNSPCSLMHICVIIYGWRNFEQVFQVTAVDRSRKSHNVPLSYHIIHHFGTEMCTFLFQRVVLCDMGQGHCKICQIGLLNLAKHNVTVTNPHVLPCLYLYTIVSGIHRTNPATKAVQ